MVELCRPQAYPGPPGLRPLRGSLQPGPLLLSLVVPSGIAGSRICPPGSEGHWGTACLLERLWLSMGPDDLGKMGHELLKASVAGWDLRAQALNAMPQPKCPLLSLLPVKPPK